ncbi:putative phosphodiesterase [Endobacter medicaginis]|uniref:Metallophosphoesterase family protein n=1 Tax=Endobacter medicaginis TaxID=1181271 RepID=A0A839V4U9_9PROT|nr:metallophosphoesterase [Endobacter medicaginis]MBB3174549.1 putative phosphodiesterase [Endobacter medicaginis]MCX5474758.1 metallophosphoesterase [Endobacter medicaginis]NVN29180.1 metallophosphoesterase family protein [Endobacter medicaginis]
MSSQPVTLQVTSDLHLEFGPSHRGFEDNQSWADIVVIAGDTDKASKAVAQARRLFASPDIVIIGGNHEHYGTKKSIDDGIAAMRRQADELSTPESRIHVLEDDAVIVTVRGTDVRIVGATLWTDFAIFGNARVDSGIVERSLNDYRLIRRADPVDWRDRLTPGETARRHSTSREFIESQLQTPHAGPTVVLTHHQPSLRCVAPQYLRDPVTAGFASNLDDLIALQPALWISGHTHVSHQVRDPGGCLLLGNPAGYEMKGAKLENPDFNPRLAVELTQDADTGTWRAQVPGSGI